MRRVRRQRPFGSAFQRSISAGPQRLVSARESLAKRQLGNLVE